MANLIIHQQGISELFSGPVAKDLERRGDNVAKAQKKNAPTDTKRMQKSVTRFDAREDLAGVYVDVGPTAVANDGFPYPLVVEYDHPFIRPSLNEARK